jgi:RimJ/RimL family protein N-acetyltransferase
MDKTHTLLLRPACIDDADVLLEWRNDETTRRNFRNTALVGREEHISWLTNVLNGTAADVILCIAMMDNIPIGTVRAQPDGEYQDLSYTIAPAWRRKGLAIPMVLQFVREYLAGKKIQCEIKKGNIPSEKVARALGLSVQPEKPLNSSDNDRLLVVWR